MTVPAALIFGVSGQTGSYLAHLLLARGYRVVGASRDAEINPFSNLMRLGIRDRIQLVSASQSDFHNVLATIRQANPDEIYSLGGQSSVALSLEHPKDAFESITMATLNILECIRLHGRPVRFFNATSSDCFGSTPIPAVEESAFRPRSPYAMAKAASFWSVASYRDSYGLFACNGILSNHESPLRAGRFVTRKIVTTAHRIARGSRERLRLGDLTVERDWGWAPDYADAIWRIVHHNLASDFLVATGRSSSLREFVEAVFAEFGLDWSDHTDTDPALLRPSEIARVEINPAKIASQLGWRAAIAMPQLARILARAEMNGTLGPLPWHNGVLADLGAPDSRQASAL